MGRRDKTAKIIIITIIKNKNSTATKNALPGKTDCWEIKTFLDSFVSNYK